MSASYAVRSDSTFAEPRDDAAATGVERVIEDIGARYVDDLRRLSEHLSRAYEAQLAAKDEEIAQLIRRLEIAETSRSILEGRLHAYERARAYYLTQMQEWNAEFSKRIAVAETEPELLEAHVMREIP